MAGKVLILDTSILCVWLQVPNMDKIVKDGEPIVGYKEVEKKIKEEIDNHVRMVLPMAVIIECGNHIAQIKGKDRYPYVQKFADFIEASIEGRTPWDIFSAQSSLFEKEALHTMISEWRRLGPTGISLGDTSIKQVAEYYRSQGFSAEIFTGDSGLKAYEPAPIPTISNKSLSRNKNRR